MAKKKKKQFNQAKFNKESGVLSYNYLGGEAGKGRGAVFIKQDGDDWYFVEENGKVRTDVGIDGKLTPVHMQNLENDGIFAAAKIKPDGTQLTKAEIKENKLSPPIKRTSLSESGNVDITSEGNLSPDLAQRGNLRLRDANEAIAPNVDNARAPVNYDQTLERRGMPTASAPKVANQSGYGDYTYPGGEGMSSISANDPTFTSNYPDRSGMGIGENIYSAPAQAIPTDPRLAMPNRPGEQQWEGAGQIRLPSDPNRVPISNVTASTPRQINDSNRMMALNAPPPLSSDVAPIAPGIDQKNLVIGEGGGTWDIDDDYYMKDGQIMKDAPWWKGGDRVATQADIDAGIKDQASPGMTSAEGWQAAGSIMKGVGGLASAYTGIKNYQLARDAFNTQKNQWQADYNQRLKAYEDNKALTNEEIRRKNRTLKARGQEESYKEI